jgi:hypothetical protein
MHSVIASETNMKVPQLLTSKECPCIQCSPQAAPVTVLQHKADLQQQCSNAATQQQQQQGSAAAAVVARTSLHLTAAAVHKSCFLLKIQGQQPHQTAEETINH